MNRGDLYRSPCYIYNTCIVYAAAPIFNTGHKGSKPVDLTNKFSVPFSSVRSPPPKGTFKSRNSEDAVLNEACHCMHNRSILEVKMMKKQHKRCRIC